MRVIQTERDAVAFMRSAKLALRYGSSAALPLPSIYSAARNRRRAPALNVEVLPRQRNRSGMNEEARHRADTTGAATVVVGG
jgi:hypothetical protein